MKTKLKEMCGAMFDAAVCKRPKGHFGKHEAGEEFGWMFWTDQGKARVEAERAAEVSKQCAEWRKDHSVECRMRRKDGEDPTSQNMGWRVVTEY